MRRIERINWSGYPPYKQSVYDQEELTALELAGRTTHKVNEVIELVNGVDERIQGKEDSTEITNKRKLSPGGNFTGTLNGRATSLVVAQVDDSLHKYRYLADQFADGQTGLVVDGGFFESGNIKKNYDGGIF